MDVKLENIVISSDFMVKIIDFAYSETTETPCTQWKGTPQYMAPEVVITLEHNRKVKK